MLVPQAGAAWLVLTCDGAYSLVVHYLWIAPSIGWSNFSYQVGHKNTWMRNPHAAHCRGWGGGVWPRFDASPKPSHQGSGRVLEPCLSQSWESTNSAFRRWDCRTLSALTPLSQSPAPGFGKAATGYHKWHWGVCSPWGCVFDHPALVRCTFIGFENTSIQAFYD